MVIRLIAGIEQAPIDRVTKSLAVDGVASQIDLSEWLFNELNNRPRDPKWAYRAALLTE